MNIRSFSIGILLVILILTGSSFQGIQKLQISKQKVKNIILFLGDGMGISHVYAAMTTNPRKLSLESFPFTGLSITYSSDNYITDSGAGGTAIACGVKTRNGMIGMSPDSNAVSSIVEIAHKNGLATGVISTKSITDATPASFIAHTCNRSNQENIAKYFLDGTVDVFIGGGMNFFRNRKDGIDLTYKLKKQGYNVVYSLDDLKKSNSLKIAGLLADNNMPALSESGTRIGHLQEMTRKAIETLSKDKDGFFLMVEGAFIDLEAHRGDLDNIIAEVVDLDNAVEVAKKFAIKNGETLIIVTADHETGGLRMVGGSIEKNEASGAFVEEGIFFNKRGIHTAGMVPIFSYGPEANRFSGIHENTFFLNEFLDLLKIKR